MIEFCPFRVQAGFLEGQTGGEIGDNAVHLSVGQAGIHPLCHHPEGSAQVMGVGGGFPFIGPPLGIRVIFRNIGRLPQGKLNLIGAEHQEKPQPQVHESAHDPQAHTAADGGKQGHQRRAQQDHPHQGRAQHLRP